MKHFTLSVALFGAVLSAGAQDLMTLKYSVAFSSGDLGDYISKTSWRGIGLGYRHMIDGTKAVGFDGAIQTFFEKKDFDTYTIGTESLSGVQYRYTHTFPISAQLDYVLNEGQDFRPYMGIGLGTLYVNRTTDFGMYRFQEDDWQFLLKPEIGLTFYMANGSAFLISGEYAVGFQTNDMEGQSYFALNVGFVFDTN